MALITPPPGAPGPQGPPASAGPPARRGPAWTPGTAGAPEATPAAQAVVALVVSFAIGIVLGPAGETDLAALLIGGLLCGIVVCLVADLRGFFLGAPGLVVGVLAAMFMGVLIGLGAALGIGLLPWQLLPLAYFTVVGLDWRWVERLRVVVLLAGVPVVFMVGLERGWTLPAALGWFCSVLLALWLLERDRRAGLDAPSPVGHAPAAPRGTSADLFTALGLALLVGLGAAFLLGNPSCSFSPPTPTPPVGTPLPNAGGGAGADPSGRSFREFELESPTNERAYEIGPGGRREFVDPETGLRDTLSGSGDTQVIRGPDGSVVGELDPDGVEAHGASEGDRQRYEIDPAGRYYVEAPNGARSYLGEDDGEAVLRDGSGEVVARDDGTGHVVPVDPSRPVLFEDRDGDGRTPVPDAAVRHGVGADGDPVGRTYESTGDGVLVTDPDGSTRIHGTDDDGNPSLRVDDGDGLARTYVTHHDDDGTTIKVYDDDGNQIDEYSFDPDQIGDGGSGDVSDPSFDPDAKDDDGGGGGNRLWWVLGTAAVLLAVAVFFYLRRRRDDGDAVDRGWAEALQRRLEEVGRERGRSRRSNETVTEYAAALVDGVLPDDRLLDVARLLSDGLFGPTQPDPGARQWARSTVEEVAEAHPLTGRRRREPASAPKA